MAHVLLNDDEVRPLSDDHVGRSPFQLLTVKKVVVGFAVVAAFLCGAAVLAPAKSMPNANLSDGIISMPQACPLPPYGFDHAARGCPSSSSTSCVANNAEYATKEDAWAACATNLECDLIMQWSDGKFYLRRDTDPEQAVASASSMIYSCRFKQAGDIVLHHITECVQCGVHWCGQGMEITPVNLASFSGYVRDASLKTLGCKKLPSQPRTINIDGGLYLVGDKVKYTYRGCFEDTRSRTLKEHKLTTGATPETCHAACSKYDYFGLQAAGHCFCGNKINEKGNKSESECNIACHSEPSTMCGGQWRNSIYENVGVDDENDEGK